MDRSRRISFSLWLIARGDRGHRNRYLAMPNSQTPTDDPSVVRYADSISIGASRVTISFNGPAELVQGLAIPAELIITKFDESDRQIWVRDFGNITAPSGPWHGFQLLLFNGGKLYAGVGTEVLALEHTSGETIWQTQVNNTVVRSIFPTRSRDALIVRTDYYHHKSDDLSGNIAALGFDGDVLWAAQLPHENDVFTAAHYVEDRLIAYSWDGFNCHIDDRTGKILSKEWTK